MPHDHSDIVGEYSGEYYTDRGMEAHSLIWCEFSETIVDLEDCGHDEINDRWVHMDHLVAYKSTDGETYYTTDTDDLVDDAINNEKILKDDAIEFKHTNGEIMYTLEKDDLVWSRIENAMIAADDAAQLSSGAWCFDNDDLIDQDEDQIKFDFYNEVEIEIGVLGVSDVCHDIGKDEISESMRLNSGKGRAIERETENRRIAA
jgi:hypothetical protein